MTGRALAVFEPLHPAEAIILAELERGDFDRLGDGLPPETGDAARTVRAAFLRFLLLGGEPGARPHEKGVRVTGAFIDGVLDLEGCRIPRDIGLIDCRFDTTPVLRSAVIDNLFLDGSVLPGLDAAGVEARGTIFLRAARIGGEVNLAGGKLGGTLEADGASISWPAGLAIDAEGLVLRAVHLRGATITGGVDLTGARVTAEISASGAMIEAGAAFAFNGDGLSAGDDLSLRGARIRGETRLIGARIRGDLDCSAALMEHPGGDALLLNRATIEGAFFLRQGAAIDGLLDLTSATIGVIHDDAAAWPKASDLVLNRCQYEGFVGGPVDATSRLDWLARQTPARFEQDFWPQPYEQLAAVFRAMGHNEDAQAVLIEKERLQRAARRARSRSSLARLLLGIGDRLVGITVGYGRNPFLAFLWLALFWTIGVGVFSFADQAGALRPASPVVLRSPEWTLCAVEASGTRFLPTQQQTLPGRALPGESQADCFRRQPEGESFPYFNPVMYSFDVLLPFLELAQNEFWRPDTNKPWGRPTMAWYYLQTILGWGLSLLAVAGFSGLVKSK